MAQKPLKIAQKQAFLPKFHTKMRKLLENYTKNHPKITFLITFLRNKITFFSNYGALFT